MQILDYIILACFAIALIVGLLKGLWSQLLGFLGVIVVTVGTAYLYQYPMSWLSGAIANTTLLTIVALLITFIVLSIVYGIISRLLKKLFTAISVLKVLDKLLGMALGLAIAYAIFAVIIAFVSNPSSEIMLKVREVLGEQWSQSWVINKLYENNFFGDWVMELIASMIPTKDNTEALVSLGTLLIK